MPDNDEMNEMIREAMSKSKSPENEMIEKIKELQKKFDEANKKPAPYYPYPFDYPKHGQVCPNCGHCPTCGRGNYYPNTIYCGTSSPNAAYMVLY